MATRENVDLAVYLGSGKEAVIGGAPLLAFTESVWPGPASDPSKFGGI
jgi:hypothetical protein